MRKIGRASSETEKKGIEERKKKKEREKTTETHIR
jgi:hypothetical protein